MASKAYVASMTVAELKAELNKRGMNTRGRKSELQDRLEMALYAEEDSESGSDSASGGPDEEQMVKQVLDSIVAPASVGEDASDDFGTFPVSIHRCELETRDEDEEEKKPLKEEKTEPLIVSIEHSRRIALSSQPSNLSQSSRSRRRRQRLNGGVTPSTERNQREPLLQHQEENLPCVQGGGVENGEEMSGPATGIEEMPVQEQTSAPVLPVCENMVGGGVGPAKEIAEVPQTPSQESVFANSAVLPPDEQDGNASIPTASQSPPQSAQEEEISAISKQIMEKEGNDQEEDQEEFVEEAASEHTLGTSVDKNQHVPPSDLPTEEDKYAVPPTEAPMVEKHLTPTNSPTEENQHVPPSDLPKEEGKPIVAPTETPMVEKDLLPTNSLIEENQHIHVPPADPPTEVYQLVPPTDPPTEENQHLLLPAADPLTEVCQHAPPTDPPTEDCQQVPFTGPPTEEYQHAPSTDLPTEKYQHAPPTDPPTEKCQHAPSIDIPTEEYQHVPSTNLPATDLPTEKYQDVPPTNFPREECQPVPAAEVPLEEHQQVLPTDAVREEPKDSPLAELPVQDEVATVAQAEVDEVMVVGQQGVNMPEVVDERNTNTAPICTISAEWETQETATAIAEVTKPTSAAEIEQEAEEQSFIPEVPTKSANLEQQFVEKEEEESLEAEKGLGEHAAENSLVTMSIPEPMEQSSTTVEQASTTYDGGSSMHSGTVLEEASAPTDTEIGESPTEPGAEMVETASRASEGDDGEKVGSDDVRVPEEGVEGQGQRVSADPAPNELDVLVHTVEEDDFSVFSAEASEAQNLDTNIVTTQPSSSTTNALSSSAAINTDGSVDNDSRIRKRASSLLSDKDCKESSTEPQPDSLKRRRISMSPKRTGGQERRRRWGSSSRSQQTPHAVISSDTLQGIIPESVRDSVTGMVEGSSALEAVMSYGKAEKAEEDVLDIGKNDTLMDEYEHEWEEKEKEKVREKEEQRKEIERARKELETRRRIEARMKAKKEERQGRLSSSEDTKETVSHRSPSPPRNPASPFLHLENLTRPFTLRQLKDLLEEDGPMIEKGFWTNKIKSHCIAVYAAATTAVATRQRLHNLKWPSTNPKLLKADFLTAQEVFKTSDGQLTADSPTLSSQPLAVNSSPKQEEHGTAVVCETEEPREREENMDVDTQPEEPTSVLEEAVPLAKQESFPNKESPKATKILDDLFRKTKAVPCIYWLPLTEEEATRKQAENKAREKERERRREERRKERELELEKEKQRLREQEREADRERREREKRLQQEQKRRERERMRRRRSWSRSRSRSRERRR